MTRTIIAILVVIGLFLAICSGAKAATPNPTITNVQEVTSAGMKFFSVTFSNTKVILVDRTALQSNDDPKIGAVITYTFEDGWFSDGIGVTQAGNIKFYGIVQ